MSFAHPPHPELVLLCGGTQQQRARFRRAHSGAIAPQAAVTTGDVQSLLRWAPRSRAVIVCGELAGIGADTIKRLVRQRAPDVPVLADERPSRTLATLPPRPATNGRARSLGLPVLRTVARR